MEIKTDSLHKIAYATDASVYREIPYGVAYPQNEDDIVALIHEARRRGTNLIARAGGTSIAGQVVGNGIVADVSRYMNRILEINAEERYAWVEPGVVRDELNLALKPYGLFFSPETSTSNRCCIGGMVGNNSCGTHSLIYGSTRPHVLEAEGILSDGSKVHFGKVSLSQESRVKSQELEQRIYQQLIEWAEDEETRKLIEDTYPDLELTRRSCGYAIDETIADIAKDRTINLCKLIAGSEGTLAFLTRIKVSLDPLPPKEVMVVCAHCVSLDAAFEANLTALAQHPTAIELMDGEILELSKNTPSVERFFVQGNPAALLIAELRSETRADLDKQAEQMEKALQATGLITVCTRVYGEDVAKVWNLRKAGLGILSSMKGDAKPTGVIEDTAVAPSRLPAYMKDFREMLKRLGTSCVFYGHISTGELHLRPILNLKTEEGRQLFRTIAHETTLLVRKHRGTISGEHGDGRLRGEFIPLQYGEPTYELMRQVKYCWDPDNIFNPHKIVDTPRMDEDLRALRSKTGDDLLCRVEQCNGAGDCRKSQLIGGTMCPTYKLTHDELQTTRARANMLREFLTANSQELITNDQSPITNADLMSALLSCLACKACRKECPSGVDMTRLRSEALQRIYDQEGTPLRTRMIANNASVQKLGSFVPHIYNFFASNKFTSAILKKIVGFAPERNIPRIQKSPNYQSAITKNEVNRALAAENHQSRRVFLFLDEFTKYNEPRLAQTFIDLMNHLGYEVIIPKHVESGRAAISKGCWRQAKKYAEKNYRLLKDLITDETPLVGIEPSCILTFRDEFPSEISKNCLLFDEFLMREVEAGRISSDAFSDMPAEIWLHGHCHQKALVGVEKTAALLRLPKNTTVHVIPSGCCGMAGSFGYEKAHYKTSIAIGEMVLFPTVREAVKNHTIERPVFIAAPGISCRTQIQDGTGVKALHPIEILYKLMIDN